MNPEHLVACLRLGCVVRDERAYGGDQFAVDMDATEALMVDAADEIERLQDILDRVPDPAWLFACMDAAEKADDMKPATNAIWAWVKAEAALAKQAQEVT